MTARRLVRAGFLALTLLALVPAMAVAQSSIAGVVKDTTGAVMPGVTVEAASPALIEQVRNDGPNSRALTIHGSRVADTNSAIDGMSDRRASTGGQAVTFYGNQGSIQEVSIVTDSGNAEQQFAGVWMNTIPKEGSNNFSYSIVGNYSNQNLSASN